MIVKSLWLKTLSHGFIELVYDLIYLNFTIAYKNPETVAKNKIWQKQKGQESKNWPQNAKLEGIENGRFVVCS